MDHASKGFGGRNSAKYRTNEYPFQYSLESRSSYRRHPRKCPKQTAKKSQFWIGYYARKLASTSRKQRPQKIFSQLKCIVIDEWHELMGSKRGVQVELALAYLKSFLPNVKIWGISATIGNLALAQEILLGSEAKWRPYCFQS